MATGRDWLIDVCVCVCVCVNDEDDDDTTQPVIIH